jgi:hypothetical protein
MACLPFPLDFDKSCDLLQVQDNLKSSHKTGGSMVYTCCATMSCVPLLDKTVRCQCNTPHLSKHTHIWNLSTHSPQLLISKHFLTCVNTSTHTQNVTEDKQQMKNICNYILSLQSICFTFTKPVYFWTLTQLMPLYLKINYHLICTLKETSSVNYVCGHHFWDNILSMTDTLTTEKYLRNTDSVKTSDTD